MFATPPVSSTESGVFTERTCRWRDVAKPIWRDLADLARDVLAPSAVARGCPGDLARLSGLPEEGALNPREFLDSICYDIGHYLLEVEYSDVVEPGYYAEQMEWYRLGHFPCGWQGKWPEGRRVIF
jgi:hypothetical protein